MICPHCQKILPENYPAEFCPFCEKDLLPAGLPDAKVESAYLSPVKFPAAIFFLILLGPPVLTAVTAWLVHVPNESYSTTIGFFGGGAAGIACGILIGLRLGRTFSARFGLSLLFSIIMVVVCITLCCFGCNLGGYQLRLN